MNRSRGPRYCRCGTRLARDHADELCSPCEKRLAALRVEPPRIPDDFWDTEQFRDAAALQHIGLVSRAYRKHPHHVALYGKDGIPQDIVGGWLGLSQPQISRIENGPPVRHLDDLTHWAKTLRIPEHLLWFTVLDSQPSHERAHTTETSPAPVASVPVQPPAAASVPCLSLSNGTRTNRMADASAMQAFRAADRQVGGGHLYATVINYLHTEVAPRLFGNDHGNDGPRIFTAAAALTEMAGWMAHDAGHDGRAQQHFGRAFDLVQIGGDHQLGAHILASQSHVAHHLGQPEKALELALRGRKTLRNGPPQPELEARLLAMQARSCATHRESTECTQLLVQAEAVLSGSRADATSLWISRFDEGSLASEAARCMRQLGDLAGARRQAERIVTLRPAEHARSRAFGQLILITVLIAQGKPDEACAVAHDVLDATASLGSFLVVRQLADLRQLLEPHRANKVVAHFLLRLDDALHERAWLQQERPREEDHG